MKRKNYKAARNRPAYPGGASHQYFVGKALETLTAIASGMGFLTVMIFFLLL